jgi:hypothetical protein
MQSFTAYDDARWDMHVSYHASVQRSDVPSGAVARYSLPRICLQLGNRMGASLLDQVGSLKLQKTCSALHVFRRDRRKIDRF